MNEKEPRVCEECGQPIPDTRNRRCVTCSDLCQRLRKNRQMSSDYRKMKGNGKENKHRTGMPGTPGTRLCAGGCGKMITDYRCPECWAKLRAASGCTAHPDEGGMEEHDSWLAL